MEVPWYNNFSKNKIIFLDIDGVLNRHSYYKHIVIEEDLAKNLKKILDSTNAKIVLSTYWRGFPDYIKYILSNYGISPDLIIGITPGHDKANLKDKFPKREVRSNQIKYWVTKNIRTISSYVILDDRDYAANEKQQLDRFIKTNGELGLTSEDVIKAINILNTNI